MYEVKNIAFKNIAINEKKGWFFNIGYNAIFQIDLVTGQLKLEAFVPEESLGVRELFGAVAYFNEKLYLAPWKDERICIYDLGKHKFDFVDLDLERYGEMNNFNLFYQAEVIDNNIYFFPGRFHAIVKLNPVDNSLEYINSWYEELSAIWNEDKSNKVIFNKIRVENAGWCTMACCRSNVILRINMLGGEFSIIESGIDGEFSDAVKFEEKYIGSFKNSGLLYEISNKGAVEIPLELESVSGHYIHKDDSNICLIPYFEKKFDIYDLNTYKKKLSYEFPDVISDSQKWVPYSNTSLCNRKIDAHRIISYSNYSGEILIIDMSECSVSSIVPTMDAETEKIIKEHLYGLFRKTLFLERLDYGLKDFFETLNAVL